MKTLYGTMLCIFNRGVLLIGPPRSGKSELALQLIARGHQLVSDDAVDLKAQDDGFVMKSPPAIQDYLWRYGLGVVNIRQEYGDQAIVRQQLLHLIIHLEDQSTKAKLIIGPVLLDNIPQKRIFTYHNNFTLPSQVESFVRLFICQEVRS